MLGGSPWIVSKRQKTGVPFQIKLMDIPMQIIKRYEPYRRSNNLFNIGSHDTINKRIKEVVPTLRAAIKAIYKSEMLCPAATQRCDLAMPKSWATFYNLEVVIALASRLNTYVASRIRQKVLEGLCMRNKSEINLFIALKSERNDKYYQVE